MLNFSPKQISLAVISASLLSLPVSSYALTMESPQYLLQSQEVTAESIYQDQPEAVKVPLSIVDQRQFDEKGFIAYLEDSSGFSASIDKTNLSFGSSAGAKSVTVSDSIHVSSSRGYQINLSQSRPLTSLTGTTFPNTTCDKSCTDRHASPWTNSTAYGLGYSLNGDGLVEDFVNGSYFRAFSDISAKETPAMVVHFESGGTTSTEMVSKLNRPPADTENYSTTIFIDILPSY
jgi:hypothetical protein